MALIPNFTDSPIPLTSVAIIGTPTDLDNAHGTSPCWEFITSTSDIFRTSFAEGLEDARTHCGIIEAKGASEGSI